MSATPASMLQIVATGLQDRERLNAPQGKPSVAFYQKVFNKRTRWASQWVRVEFDGLADFGRNVTTTLPIRGELITRATLVVVLPDILTPQLDPSGNPIGIGPAWSWTNGLGHAICSNVQFLIDDQIIDEFDSQLLEVIDEQERPVEHFDSTNTLIARDPSAFSDQAMLLGRQKNPQTLEVVFPFWWNRGPGPNALPIQALWKDKVQLRTTFRPAQQCVYTSTRINPLNPPLSINQGAGPLPNIAGCGFFTDVSEGGVPIYDAAATATLDAKGLQNPFNGQVVPGAAMPAEYHFQDAYWIVEYVSLEDREAAAFRLADQEFSIQQHVAVPPFTTNAAGSVRINLEAAGLVRDLMWVAQRVEAPTYNAYFLFSRDLSEPKAKTIPSDVPWWPNAQIPNWDYGDGIIVPAFANRYSDPIVAAKLLYRGRTRFEHEGAAVFRSLIPALNCKRAPLIDRYIYRYDFGYWPTGGLADALYYQPDEIRGAANWDKIPNRELVLTMNQPNRPVWISDPANSDTITFTGRTLTRIPNVLLQSIQAFRVRLTGAGGRAVYGIVDCNKIQQITGFRNMYVRLNLGGSAALFVETVTDLIWIAVAGGQGQGAGGCGSSPADIGGQGVTGIQTHELTLQLGAECSSLPVGGGGGGGRYDAAGPGLPDGATMTTDRAFVMSHLQTGGKVARYYGGDGYYGGGSGSQGGGGGGSYVSCYIAEVGSAVDATQVEVSATLIPVVRTLVNPNFNILAWITRYNRLRIVDGRGSLMFNDTV